MSRPLQSALTRSVSQAGVGRALPRARAEVDRLSGQLASGYRITRPSDDPSGFARARDLGRLQDRLAQYDRGLDAATLWSDRTMSELDGLSELFSQANEAGLRAANGVLDPDELADQIESIRTEVIARLNAQSGGEHLFAGDATTTAPVNADGTLAALDTTGERRREVAPGVTVSLATQGALEVGGVPAPEVLQALADAVRGGDTDAIAAAIEQTQAGTDHYVRLGARAGGVSRSLLNARDALVAQDQTAGEARAAIEEVDLAEVLGEMQRRQTGLEAALRATASSVQTSILNYLQ